jgi:hypothetical protein
MHLALDPAILNGSIISRQENIMMTASVSQANALGLPQAFITAQEAIHLPEVQEMLRRLSEYQLGIFMPHMHDEQTGEFKPLPDEVIQVEAGLAVSFQPTAEIANQSERFLPVGWVWRAGASAPSAVCEMVRDESSGDMQRYGKHKHNKPKGN